MATSLKKTVQPSRRKTSVQVFQDITLFEKTFETRPSAFLIDVEEKKDLMWDLLETKYHDRIFS